MISVVIPSYKNPEYLELCLESAFHYQQKKNEIIVVIDGFTDMYEQLYLDYPYPQVHWVRVIENQGLPMATNLGVMEATNENILIVNEDNVFPIGWDADLESLRGGDERVYAVQQVEPTDSIFKFLKCDCGSNPKNFDMAKFQTFVLHNQSKELTDDAYHLPIYMSKKLFMSVGGWDVTYSSPFVVDLDFFLKLELIGSLAFIKVNSCPFYHFGSRSTKKRQDANEIQNWESGERYAAEQFKLKWGIYPQREALTYRINDRNLRGIV